MKRVVIGMSGGVDSSVAAICLKEQGYEVIGLFMRNWDSLMNNDVLGNDNLKNNDICPQEKDYNDALELCNKLDIKVSKEDDMLSDDDIIILDNELASIQPSEESTEELEELEELEDIEESYEEQIKEENKAKKKKTGLIVTLVVLVAIIAAAVVLLITPVKSPLPIKFRCDDCNKIKYSEKYEVEYEDTGKVEERYICKDCFEENGYEEQ